MHTIEILKYFKIVTVNVLYCSFVLLQPMVFGAMIHRDEAFDAINTQYTKITAMGTATNPET